ncbi:g7442 [Coccomyxa viridis]|uniref:G7442 protein n=1 Tax=Coccomyxa viridis TaxID=1274662 RepID=A0ABP1FZ02_9CHLO
MPSKGTSILVKGQHLEILRQWWRISYWYGFIAQFTILPFHQEYADSGAFTVWARIGAALKNNLIFYAVLTVVGAVGLVLLLATGELAPTNVLGFCVAASNAFGLIAGKSLRCIFLMGYGLVAIPRQLWRIADIKGAEKASFHKAGLQADRAIAAKKEMERVAALVNSVSGTFGRRDFLRRNMDKIEAMIADSGESAASAAPAEAAEEYFDLEDLGRLRRNVRRAIENVQRERELYHEIVLQYLEISDVLANRMHRGQPFHSSTRQQPLPVFLQHAEWWWRCVLRGWVYRLLAILTALMSAAIVLAEATISPYLPNMSIVSRALHQTSGNELATELLTFVSLAYPCLCAWYAIYKLGRFSFYLLVPRHTSPFSLLANAMLMCRFAPPLAFNFMAGIALPPGKSYSPGRDVTETVFYEEFGVLMMHQPLIGWDFTTYLPAALVPYILLLLCNAFNRVASLFTRSDSMEFEDDFETQSGAAARGMQLLQMELENFNAGRPLGLTISTQGTEGSGSASVKPRAGARSWMFWKSSASSSLLEGELDAEASSPPAVGRSRRNKQPLSKQMEEGGSSVTGTGSSRDTGRRAGNLDSIFDSFAKTGSSKDAGNGKGGEPFNLEPESSSTGLKGLGLWRNR